MTAPDRSRSPLLTVVLALGVSALDAALLAFALGGVAALLAHPQAVVLTAHSAGHGLSRPPPTRGGAAREQRGKQVANGIPPNRVP